MDIPRDRWFGIGHSVAVDAELAGAEAARTALDGRAASLLLVFCSVSYDLPSLLDAIRKEASDGTVIAGCSTMGEVHAAGPSDNSVLVVALGGPGFQVSSQSARNITNRRRAAGAEAAACVAAVDRPHRVMMMLFDGLTGEQQEVVRGAYGVVGSTVPLVGGCAADDLAYECTYQFHGDANQVEILSDAVIGIALGSDAPLGVGLAHGWRKLGEAMVVTRSEDGVVFELDNEPALDVYLRRLGADRGLAADGSAFREASFSRPFGMSRRSSEDIRAIHTANLVDGSLRCLADVPQGALVWLMEADDDALVSGGGESFAQAIAGLNGEPPIGLVAFDCGGRKIMLGADGTEREIHEITRIADGVPFGGFYTYGEVARTRGSRGMHNLTLVSLAIA